MDTNFKIIKLKHNIRLFKPVLISLLILFIPVTFLLSKYWLPFLFIIPISFFVLMFFLEKWIYQFRVVGHIQCLHDKLVIKSKNYNNEILFKDIKGINLSIAIPHPGVKGLNHQNQNNAVKLNIKSSLSKNLSFIVFNYVNSNKWANSRTENTFLKLLKHNTKHYHIRFWDKKGGKSHII